MMIYTDIVKEASAFYSSICPAETAAAKISMSNIGKTLVEQFPVLAVSGHQNPWSYFNDKLSSALRNTRCRMKRKLAGLPPGSTSQVPKKLRVIQPPTDEISEDAYARHVAALKAEACKTRPDLTHMKSLLHQTHVNRRKWIDGKPSTELRLATVLEEYTCFHNPEMLLEEFRFFKGSDVVDKFAGFYDCPLR